MEYQSSELNSDKEMGSLLNARKKKSKLLPQTIIGSTTWQTHSTKISNQSV